MTDKLRIGAVAYLNTRPLVFGLEEGLGKQRIELSYDVPAVLADRMRRGSIDVALLPIVELSRIPALEIVPGLGIVTDGPARSVLLITRRSLEEVRSVALDRESRTSNALTRVLFADAWGVHPRFEIAGGDTETVLREHDAVVRIGDKALYERLPAGCTAIDLGQAWTERTGLPFVFAVWAGRPGVVDTELYGWLHESLRRGTGQLRAIAEKYEWDGRRAPDLSHEYLERNILFRLGARELQSMRAFFEAAARLGVIDEAPPIRMALEHRAECREAAQRPREKTL